MNFEELCLFQAGPFTIYRFGLFVAAGVLLFFLCFLWQAKKQREQAVIAALPAILCGVILSRVLYCAADQRFFGIAPFSEIFDLTSGGFSMMGALIGVCAGMLLAGALMKTNKLQLLDAAAPGMMLFVLCVRLGEFGTDEFGVSKMITVEGLKNSFLTFNSGEYPGLYIMVYLLEAVFAVIIFAVLLARKKDRFMTCMILFGALQVICESLTHDGHMSWGFTGVQHILSYLILAGAVIYAGVLCWKKENKGLPLCAFISAAPVAGAAVALEFLYDRTRTSPLIIYAGYVILVAYMAVLGFLLLNKAHNLENNKDSI